MKGSKRLKNPLDIKWTKPNEREVYFALFVLSPLLIWVIAKLWVLPIIIN